MRPSEEFYADIDALRRRFGNDDAMLINVARGVIEQLQQLPDSDPDKKHRLQIISALLEYLTQTRH